MVGFLFLFLVVGTAHGNSLSETGIQDLLEVEHQFILNFQNFANELQGKLNSINGALTEYSELVKDAATNPELFLSNPLSAFRIVRHMREDWAAWQLKMEEQLGSGQIEIQKLLLTLTPKQSIFKMTAKRLQSIFKFYNISPASSLQNNNKHLRLSPVDCYYMGMELYEQKQYHDAAEWLAVAAENYTTSRHNDLISVSHWRVYEMRSKVLTQLKMFDDAHVAISNALNLNPGNDQLLEQQQKLNLIRVGSIREDPIVAPAIILSDLQQQCGSVSRQDNSLSCELVTDVTPFLYLAPLRVEDLCYYPYVMTYKDGIYDREIQIIKKAFASCSPINKFKENDDISGCLIPGNYSPIVQTLSARMQDMAGLDGATDGLIVLEYGSTDPFKPFQLSYLNSLNLADVEATAILFLNEVALGGALTIPDLDVVVFPRRGDALVTFNEGNFEHTLCPNIVGTSMIAVKFMYTKVEQEDKVEEETE